MKKLLTLLFAAALTLSLSSAVFAQDTAGTESKDTKKEAKAEKKAAKKEKKAAKKEKKAEKKDEMKKDDTKKE